MPKKKQNTLYVEFPRGFRVKTPLDHLKGELFTWTPDALYIIFSSTRAELHYAGKRAGESGIAFDIPASPDFLRQLGEALIAKADELES